MTTSAFAALALALAVVALLWASPATAQCFGTAGSAYYQCRAGGNSPLLPYGAARDTRVLQGYDDGYTYVSLAGLGATASSAASFGFYGATWSGLYLSVNGQIGFSQGMPSWNNKAMPLNPAQASFLAPFWADTDTTSTPQVPAPSGCGLMYRVRTIYPSSGAAYDLAEVAACTQLVRQSYLGTNGTSPFSGRWCAIVTWDNMPPFNRGNAWAGALNTYQVVLVSDGTTTYAVFNYAASAPNAWWNLAESMKAGAIPADTYPTVGFDAGDATRSFRVSDFDTPYVPWGNAVTNYAYLVQTTNTLPVAVPGRRIYKVSGAEITKPPTYLSNDASIRNLTETCRGADFIPAFNPNQLSYTLIVNRTLCPSFQLFAYPNDTQAELYVNGVKTSLGVPTSFSITTETQIQLSVISVLGATRTYVINANVVRSPDATVSAIGINSPTIPFAFFSGTYNYLTLEIDSVYRSIGMTTVSSNANALVRILKQPDTTNAVAGPTAGGANAAPGTLVLNYKTNGGVTDVTVECTAQNTVNVLSYNLRITMRYNTSTALSDVSVAPAYTIVSGGNPVGTTRSWTVASADSSTTITARAAFAFAVVALNGTTALGQVVAPLQLAFGLNYFVAQVTSEQGSASTNYQLYVTRPRYTDASIVAITLVTDLGVLVGPFPAAAWTTESGGATITRAVPYQTTTVRVVVALSDSTYATATLTTPTVTDVPLTQNLPSTPVLLATEPFAGTTTQVTVRVTAHDTSVVRNWRLVITKPQVPSYSVGSGCMTPVIESLSGQFGEVKHMRLTLPPAVDALTVSAVTNVTGVANAAPKLYLRRAQLPVITGTTAWDATSPAPTTPATDVYATAVLLNPTPSANNYYLSYTQPQGTTAGARFTITVCAVTAATVALNTAAGGVVARNGWTFWATQQSNDQFLPALVYTMTPTFSGSQSPANPYFRTYSAVEPGAADEDAFTIFPTPNPALNPGAGGVYTATTTAPPASSRVLYGVFAVAEGLPNIQATYTVAIQANAATPEITLANPLTGPTAGGLPAVVLTGNNFEPPPRTTASSTLEVTFGGVVAAPASPAYDSQGRLQVIPPPGEGTTNQIVVKLYGKTSAPFVSPYVYTAPTLSLVNPSGGPTAGGTSIVVTGSNLGQTATVTVGGKNCPVTNRATSTLTCTVPAGEGVAAVVVTAGGQANIGTQLSYTYDLPVPQSYAVSNAATTGNNPIEIFGYNFGSATATRTVTIGGNACAVTFANQTAIRCTIPPGAGQAQQILIRINTRANTVPLGFTYAAPTLTSISPNPVLPTTTTLVLTGTNFGPANVSPLAINLLGGLCTLVSKDHSTITCTAPARNAGKPNDPYVVVASQPSAPLTGFGYAPPVISYLSSSVGDTDGTTVIFVAGTNFLGAPNDVAVTLNGASQATVLGPSTTPVRPAPNNTHVFVRIPAGSGSNLLQLTVGGLTSNSLTFTYAAPVIDAVNIQPFADGGAPSVVITGRNFASSTGTVLVSNGGSCSPSAWSTSSITCAFPPGVGTVNIRVVVGSVQSAPFAVTYRAPVINGVPPIQPTSPGVTTAGTDVITLYGRNFGPATEAAASSFVTVKIGTGLVQPCPRVTWSDTTILCTAPVGNGTNLQVTVTVAGQVGTATGLNYRGPTVTNAQAATYPTAGGVALVITGTSLDSYGSVTVGGVACPVTAWSNTGNSITCTLPVGGGANQPLVVKTNFGLSSTAFSVSYSAPSIAQIVPNTLNTAGQTILIRGTNLGGTVGQASVAVSDTTGGHTVTFVNHTHAFFTLGSTPTSSSPSITWTYAGLSSAAAIVGIDPPQITNLIPSNGPTGPAYNLTLVGTGFGDGTRATAVSVGSQNAPVLAVTAFQVIVRMPPGGFNQQPVSINVGGAQSNNQPFQFDRPRTLGVSPATALLSSGAQNILVVGSSFGTSPTAYIGTTACATTTSINDTALTCTTPSGVQQNLVVSVQVGSQTSTETAVRVSYELPVITSVGPQPGPSAGCTACLIVTGSGFGPSGAGGIVKVGTLTCAYAAANYAPTSITCNLPAGMGFDLPVQVTVNGNPSNTLLFAYAKPAILAVATTPTTTRPNTLGGTPITITGSDFGSSGSVSVNGTAACNLAQPSDWQPNQIVCSTPAGAGRVSVVVTAGSGPSAQSSEPSSFLYAAPVVGGATPLQPANGPTLGGTALLISGSQFYTSGRVLIGGRECVPSGTKWTQTRIECTTPPGAGGAQTVEVFVFGQSTSYTAFLYDAPVVTNVVPGFGPTNAGQGSNPDFETVVIGSNFGVAGSAPTVIFGAPGGPTCVVKSNNHTHIVCASAPNGVGAGKNVQVQLASQASPTANLPFPLFSYLAPVLTSLGGCQSDGANVINCDVTGSGSLQLNGNFFGQLNSVPAPVVRINGVPCSNLAFVGVAGQQATCDLPPLPTGISFNIPVTITVGDQVSQPLYMSYAGPRLTAHTLTVGGSTAPGGSVTVDHINGTEVLSFQGTFLDQFNGAHTEQMKFGPSGTAPDSMPFTCTIVTFNNTAVTCQIEALPVGAGLVFVYNDGRQWSPESADTLSFPAPAFLPGTIRGTGAASAESTAVAGKSPQGEVVRFKVLNVGNRASALTVFYDLPGGTFDDPNKQCQFVSISQAYDPATGISQIECRTQPGAGGPYHFKVRAYGAVSAESTDSYSYPQPPLVYGVRGSGACENDLVRQTTSNCPTLGGVSITLNGTSFADDAAVKVGAFNCPVTSLLSSQQMVCTLPAGTGLDQAITVFSGSLLSNPARLLSYREANITAVKGCTDSADGSTGNCPRTGAIAITVTGRAFGASGAQMFIGSTPCPVVTHTAPDTELVCANLPPGVELNQPVLVLQASGQVSIRSGLLSYAPCPTGTYQASFTDYACTACAKGTFTDSVGRSVCTPCPRGQYQGLTGRSLCNTCGSGSFAPVEGSWNCTACPMRTASVALGAQSCDPCGPGRFSDAEGLFTCKSCPTGTTYDGVTPLGGVTACGNCTQGRFSNVAGTSDAQCTACAIGSFSRGTGNTGCTQCPVGKAQISQGTTFCADCLAGTYATFPGSSQCLPCDPGTFMNVSLGVSCLTCPAGKYSGPQASQCLPCAAGKFSNKPGQGACINCPAGSFASGTGAVECTLCPRGQASGSTDDQPWQQCTNCSIGFEAPNLGQAQCTACKAGSFASGSGTEACSPCAAGYFAYAAGASQCLPCGIVAAGSQAGQINPNTGQSACVWCEAGTFSVTQAATTCTNCPIGTFGPADTSACTPCGVGRRTLAAKTLSGGCKNCPPGTRQPDAISGTCIACDLGQTSTEASGVCTDCLPGFWAGSLSSPQCDRCPAGQFSNTSAASACTSCQPGFYAPTQQATTCVAAQAGSYVPAPRALSEQQCPKGSYSNTTGAATCTPCEVGKALNVDGATQCVPCAPGSSTNLLGQTACQPCPQGYAQADAGSSVCQPCAAGSAAITTGLQTCPQCAAGKYQADTGKSICLDCAAGTFNDVDGLTYCGSCPAGSSQSEPGKTACGLCLAGQFGGGVGAQTCGKCPQGRFNDRTNQTACVECAVGFAQGAEESTACAECATGKYAFGVGNAVCTDCAAGTFGNQTQQPSCVPCAPGTYQPTGGQTTCLPCAAGYENPASGQSECTRCVAGHYAPIPGMSACIQCPVGTSCVQTGQSSPDACLAGWYASGTRTLECSRCPAGTYTNVTGQSICAQCSVGSFQPDVGQSACRLCAEGSRADTVGRQSCEVCDKGSVALGQGNSQCTLCTPGYAQPQTGQKQCEVCGTGTYRGQFSAEFGAESCVACDIGSAVNSPAAASCTRCTRGTVAPTTGSSSCSPCARGKYQSAEGQGVCVDCESGSFANTTGQSACYACNVGRYAVKDPLGSSGPQECAACPQGKFGNQFGLTACLDCPLGTANQETAQTECASCIPGKAQSTPGSTVCVDCPAGSVSAGSGAIQCTACDPGFFAYSGGGTECVPCAKGAYFNTSGATECNQCATGYYAPSTGSINCVPCEVGKFNQAEGQEQCSDCAAGSASARSAQSSCTPCTAGSYTAIPGQVACLPCPSGSVTAIDGLSVCTPCDPGSSQPSSGRSFCVPCGPGEFASAPGQLTCERCTRGSSATGGNATCGLCAAGKFGNNTGDAYCIDCPPGSYTSTQGQTVCLSCQRGTAQPQWGSTACVTCEPGFVAQGAAAAECVPCGTGLYNSFLGAYQCVSCAQGTYAPVPGSTGCALCPAGKSQDALGQAECLNCTVSPQGRYQNLNGQSICFECQAGSYQDVPGRPGCTPCGNGTYSQNTGQNVCDQCPPGRSNNLPGQRQCALCTPGTFSNTSGLLECVQCPRGKYQSASGETRCMECLPGFYAPVTGQAECAACPVGQFINATGASACSDCPVGRYNDENVSPHDRCVACLAGRYAPGEGSASCLECQPGSAAANPGAASCLPCAPGYSVSSQGATECNPCDISEYAAGNGSRSCNRCPPGTANNLTAQTACAECKPGFQQPDSRQPLCVPCESGTYTDFNGTINCPSCPSGRYSNQTGALTCPTCPPGTSQAQMRSNFCDRCGVGRFATGGSTSCDSCPTRTANPNTGASTCYACPANGFANTVGTQCLCNVDYAATYHYDYSDRILKIQCQPCPEGAVCDAPGTIWDLMLTRRGYWAPWVGTYYRCILDTQCVGGEAPQPPFNAMDQVYGPGWTEYRDANGTVVALIPRDEQAATALPANLTTRFVPTPGPASNTAQAQSNNYEVQAVQCAANRGYVLCSLCDKGYTESIAGDCQLCPSTQVYSYVLTGGMLLVFLACVVLAFWAILESGSELMQIAAREDEKMARQRLGYVEDFADDFMALRFRHGRTITVRGPPAPKPDFTFKVKIVLGFLQIMSNLAINLDIRWPTRFKQFVNVFSPTNLDFVKFASVDCITQGYDYYSRLILFSLAPPILVGLIVLVYYLPMTLRYDRSTREGRVERKRVRRNFWKLVQFALFLLYPSVSSVVLRVYVCKKIGDTRYLQADFTIQCDTDTWRNAAGVSVIMIGAYVIGIPLLFAAALLRYRKRLDESGIRAQYGFLYDAYERRFFWFELVDMAHKLLVTSIVAFFPFEMQLPAATVFVVGFMCVILVGRPYLRKGDDRLHIFAQIEICLAVVAGNVVNTIFPISDDYDLAISIVLVVLVCLFFLYFLAGALSVLWKLFKATAFAQRFAMFRDDKKKKKAFKKDDFARVLDAYNLDRNQLRRQPLGQKAGEDAGVTMARNPLFMAGGTAGTALVDEHDQTVVEVMVNPLLLDKVREAVEEKARQDAFLAAEAEKRRLAREAELKKQREDEELAEQQYQDLLLRAQMANEEEAKALREQAAALKERHDSPMRIDDIFFTAADPLAQDQGAIKAEFAPSGADTAVAAAGAGSTGAPASGADELLDPTLLNAAPVASASASAAPGDAAAADAALPAVDMSALAGIGTLDAGPAPAASADSGAADATAAAAAPATADAPLALADLGSLDSMPTLDAPAAAAPAAASEDAPRATRPKKEKEIDDD